MARGGRGTGVEPSPCRSVRERGKRVVSPDKSAIKCILRAAGRVKRGIRAAEMPIDSVAEALRGAVA
jgi:hypothetical protein